MAEQQGIPGLREHARTLVGYVQSVLADKEKRAVLLKDSQAYVQIVAETVKDHVTDADKRNQLLGHAHEMAAAAYAHATDAEKRAAILEMCKQALAYAEQFIKDPAKRAEFMDLVRSVAAQLTQAMNQQGAAAPAAAAPTAPASS